MTKANISLTALRAAAKSTKARARRLKEEYRQARKASKQARKALRAAMKPMKSSAPKASMTRVPRAVKQVKKRPSASRAKGRTGKIPIKNKPASQVRAGTRRAAPLQAPLKKPKRLPALRPIGTLKRLITAAALVPPPVVDTPVANPSAAVR